jgi:hypothetical protein
MSALPASLPERLTITLWGFSWYVRTGPGEPFEDLDAAFAQAVERGCNTVRLAAAHADLLALLVAERLADRVAFTEIHNEAQIGHLADGLADDVDAVVALRPQLERAVDLFHARHPGRRSTASTASPWRRSSASGSTSRSIHCPTPTAPTTARWRLS